MSNSLDTDQDRQNVRPDLGPMFAKVISKRQMLSLARKELIDVDHENFCLFRFYQTEEMVYGAREFHTSTRKSIRMNLHRTC